MKKTLLTALLGASFIFGGNELKAQVERGEVFYKDSSNYDSDSYLEEITLSFNQGINKDGKYIPKKMGSTAIGFFDFNKDNFRESIRIFNCDSTKTLTFEDIYIDVITGLLDYSVKATYITTEEWQKYYGNKDYTTPVREGLYKDFSLQGKKEFYYVEKDSLNNIYPEFKSRVQRLANVDYTENTLEKLAKSERNYWSKIVGKQFFK